MSDPEFSVPDRRAMDAVEGWLALGDWNSALEELEKISPPLRSHPDVLKLRVETYSTAKKWGEVVEAATTFTHKFPDHPFGFVHRAFALHELKRTREAWESLLPIAEKFPEEWVIPYNLACYACQLGDLVGARDWLAQAFRLGNVRELKAQAMADPDLAPLFQD